MSLSSSVTVKSGVTSFTITGGSDTVFINDGQGTAGAKVLVDSSNGNLLTRRKIITKVVAPAAAPNANALAKLGRSSMVSHNPYVDAAGKSYKCPATTEITYHPAMSEAERKVIFWNHIAALIDSELENLFVKGVND